MHVQGDLFGGEVQISPERRPEPPAPKPGKPEQLALITDDSREFVGQAGMLDVAGQIPDAGVTVQPFQPFRPPTRKRVKRPGGGGPIPVVVANHRPEPLIEVEAAGATAEPVSCMDCGRQLTDPESIERGRGPVCTAKAHGAHVNQPDLDDDNASASSDYEWHNGRATPVVVANLIGALL